jgi:MFS family permease
MRQLSGFAEFLKHPRQQPTNLAFSNGFVYGLSLNTMMLLVPLYAISQDFALSDQGIVIAAPAVFMVILRLPGGAISDRFGERVVIWFAFVTLLAAAITAAFSDSIMPLIISQLFSGASRSVYWSAAQSYISRSAEGQAGKVMGRQLAFESGAGIIGAIGAGFVAQFAGFGVAFGIAAGLCTLGILVTTSLPSLARKDQVRSMLASFAPVKTMLFSRSLAFAHLVSFMAASYAGLMGGLVIAHFRDVGYSEGFTGLVRAFNGIGVVFVAFLFGVFLARFGAKWTGIFGMVATGLVAIGVAATGDIPVLPVALMTISGVTFGTLRTLYPVLATEKSVPAQRAMALSVVSLYWAIAMLLSPFIFGFIAEATSIKTALYIFGAFSVIVGLLSPLVYALGNTAPAPGPVEAAEPAKP